MNDETRNQAEERLKRIAGQVAGIQRMLGEDRNCIDVLLQITAAQAALMETGRVILAGHVENCLADATKSREPKEHRKKVGELVAAIFRFGRFQDASNSGTNADDVIGRKR
jgi:CsoR family transcriptional regulator, copper-sensing transcriptional repressor